MKDIKKTLIKYLITVVIGGALVALSLWARDFGALELAADRYRALADAFTIPGVVLVMLGILILLSTDGFFDILTFALGRLGRALIPGPKSSDETFYDYKQRKKDKRLSGYACVFIVGAVFIAVAVVFTILYYM